MAGQARRYVCVFFMAGQALPLHSCLLLGGLMRCVGALLAAP